MNHIAGHLQNRFSRRERAVGTVYEIDVFAKDGRRIALEVSARVVSRDGVRLEVLGIAVPSVIRTLSQSRVRSQCVDEDFFQELHPRC